VIANDRACPRLPPLNLHGKEGVDGSSPSEGFNLDKNKPRKSGFFGPYESTAENLRIKLGTLSNS
jgi:hypothetical protein